MEYRKLGGSDLEVSVICLGSMTWGEQNNEQEGHEQLDYALAQGVNFVDTAELYAIPPKAETYGRTEEIIGSWLKRSGKRDRIVLASKIAGPGEWIPHIRDGKSRYDRPTIEAAVEGSLRRLQTDYIDLYQLHWPERSSNFFGELAYTHDGDDFTSMEETLTVLGELIQAGKIRHFGLSNETAWGAMKFQQTAERLGLPRPVSIQNPYSLLNRSFEVGLAEVAHREKMGLLAYSPLGFGELSGKYLDDKRSTKGRIDLFPDYTRYSNPQARAATAEYVTLARSHGLQPARMALAYVNSRSFLTSTIVGATTMEQLRENIGSSELRLDEEVLKGIEEIHARYTYPSP